jgi:hypothetical protein
MCMLEPLALLPLEGWLDRQRRMWERQLGQLAAGMETGTRIETHRL